jgi:uncharacterized protein YkwD
MNSTISFSKGYIRTIGLCVLAARLVVFFSDVPVAAAAPGQLTIQSKVEQAFAPTDFLELTNAARTERGVAPLTLNNQLNNAALAKAEDMAAKGYWEHFRPSDHKAPWAFIAESGYQYRVAGENLAKGFRTPEGITKAWIASPAHYANMVSPKYTEVGFASIEATMDGQPVLLTVEMFGSR